MSLAKRTVLVFSLLGLCLCGGAYSVQKFAVLPTLHAYQREAALDSVARVQDALDAELRVLDTLNTEYSYWDDTYAFVQGRDDSFVDENLREDYLLELGIDLLLIADSDGVERFLFVRSPDDGNSATLGDLLLEPASPRHPLFRPGYDSKPVTGTLVTRRGLLCLVSYPIVRTSGRGPSMGSLAMGRFLDAEALAAIGERVTANVTMYDFAADAVSESLDRARTALSEAPDEVFVAPDELDVPGYFLISDLFGTPAEIVEVADRGSLGNIAAVSIRSATLLMATACLLFVLLAWLLAQRFVVRPVRDLSEEIHRIRATGDLKVDSVFRRSDEVGRLSSDFAGLTAELAQAQEELELARDEAIEASNTKSEFLARMSHEIRTPLNGVLGMAEVLRSTSLSGRQAAITDTIQRSGRTLLELINDILDFSKIEAGKMQLMPVESDLRSLLEDTMATFAMQAENKGVDLRLQVEPPLEGSVWLDPVRVRQVLNNLLDNALKFTLEGSVTLSVHGEQTSRGTLLTEFAVTDTGIGIEPELLQVIFDSFAQADSGTTRRFGGTGLGLTICRQLVELMGGHIGVSSEPNEGSRFVFTLDLPMDPERTAASKYRAPNSEAKRVLIADDNPVDQTVTAASVRYLDLEPTVVEGGERAVQAAACGRYAAILLDCAMPEVDGYAAARAIRAQERESSRQPSLIVGLTADSVASDRERCVAAGMDGCLSKPFEMDELRRALAPLLDEANA